jgi:flagellar biosynthesis protein FlhF
MKFKKFVAPTLKEATEMMKKELGENAIVIGTRRIRQPGLFGFFKPELIEIVGAVEEEIPQERAKVSSTVELLKKMTQEIEAKRKLTSDEIPGFDKTVERYDYSQNKK